jgi:hypothetical protein
MPDRERKTKPAEESDLVEAARVNGPFEADVIKSFLESHGIASIVRGRTAPFVYPLTVDGMAEFKILVQQEDLEKARDLVAARVAPDDEEGPDKPA